MQIYFKISRSFWSCKDTTPTSKAWQLLFLQSTEWKSGDPNPEHALQIFSSGKLGLLSTDLELWNRWYLRLCFPFTMNSGATLQKQSSTWYTETCSHQNCRKHDSGEFAMWLACCCQHKKEQPVNGFGVWHWIVIPHVSMGKNSSQISMSICWWATMIPKKKKKEGRSMCACSNSHKKEIQFSAGSNS